MATKKESVDYAKKHREELVPYFAFKDSGKYKEDIFVSINGKAWQIRRGVRVMIPRYVRDVLEQSASQDRKRQDLEEGYEREYNEQTERYGYK